MNQYNAMFKTPFFVENVNPEQISRIIKCARETMKRKDRIIWLLRIIRASYVAALSGDTQLQRKYRLGNCQPVLLDSDVFLLREAMKLSELLTQFEHYFAYDYAPIMKIVFTNQSIETLLSEFAQLEQEFKDMHNNRTVPEYGMPLVSVDGLKWFDLERPNCHIEGKAMHHCGNGGRTEPARIFSLRSKNSDGSWTPHITLTFNDYNEGRVGEIKGFGNSRPSEKYNNAMREFIRLDIVKRLDNNGYRPENNWNVDMLEDDELETLLAEKPTLLGERALFERFAGGHLENIVATHKDTLDPLFVYAVTGDTSNLDVIDSPCIEKDGEDHLAILLGQGIDDVADTYNVETCKAVLKSVEDDQHDVFSSEESADGYTAKELFSYLLNVTDDVNTSIEDVIDSLIAQYDEEDTDEVDTLYEKLNFLFEQDNDELCEAVNHAYTDGLSMGAENEMVELLDNYIKDLFSFAGTLYLKDEKGNKLTDPIHCHCKDENIYLRVKKSDYITAVFETYQAGYYGDVNIIEIALDMIDDEACLYDTYNEYLTDKQKDFVEPYYGYSGYDKEAAGNRFVELITEIEISEVA